MNDKELDDFFRNKSEHPDLPYREKDWEKLRDKLDNPPPSPRANGSRRGNKGWWIGLLVLAVISGAGLGLKYWDEVSVNPNIAQTVPSKHIAINQDRMESQNKETNSKEVNSFPVLVSPLSQVTEASAELQSPIARANHEGSSPSQEASLKSEDAFLIASNSSTREKHDFQTIAIELDQPRKKPNSLEILINKEELRIAESLPKVQPSSASESINKKRDLDKSRFYTTLTLSPDVSALKIKDISGVGNSLGLNLEYFIHPNISINAGALYVFKTYRAGEGYSTGYAPGPNHVDGNCWVLDLPLNLRYYTINQRLSRWYLTAGLSSYLMLKEKYDLNYQSYHYGGSVYDNRLEVRNKNRHYLDIVNLGLGYERVLTNKLSLQVEPYLKLPLKGIGEGDISLKSAGAFVGLKYGW